MTSLTYTAISFTALLCAAACSAPVPQASNSLEGEPKIISLDFCADQYVLELLPRAQILALSPDASAEFSYHKTRATNIPTVRPRAEDVLALKPDLIIRSYGGGPRAERIYETAGVPVINIGWASQLSGESDGSVISVIRQTARALGQTEKGEALIENYQSRLTRLESNGLKKSTALYMTPYGVTTGAGSLVDQIMTLAGYENFQTQAGWHPLPLERLTTEAPDHIITSFFDSHNDTTANWSAMRHPVARRALGRRPALPLKGAWTSCGAWFLIDAAESLSHGAQTSITPPLKEGGL